MSGIFGPSATVDQTEFGAPGLEPTGEQTLESELSTSARTGPLFNVLTDVYNAAGNLYGVPKLNKKQWQQSGYNVPGLKFDTIADDDGLVNETTARLLANRQQQLNDNAMVAGESDHSIADLAGQALGFMTDPINYAATVVAPMTVGALGEMAASSVDNLVEAYGLDNVGEVASNPFFQKILRGGAIAALGVTPQAASPFFDITQNADDAAFGALHTLSSSVLLGGGIDFAGEFLGLALRRTLSKINPELQKVFRHQEMPATNIDLINKQYKTTALDVALAQAAKDKNIDVMDVLKDGYNNKNAYLDTSNDNLSDIGSPILRNLIAKGLRSKPVAKFKEGEIESTLSDDDETTKKIENSDHYKLLIDISDNPTMPVDPNYQRYLLDNLESTNPSTFYGYSPKVDRLFDEGLDIPNEGEDLEGLKDRIDAYAQRDDLSEEEKHLVGVSSDLNDLAEKLPNVYKKLGLCLQGEASE